MQPHTQGCQKAIHNSLPNGAAGGSPRRRVLGAHSAPGTLLTAPRTSPHCIFMGLQGVTLPPVLPKGILRLRGWGHRASHTASLWQSWASDQQIRPPAAPIHGLSVEGRDGPGEWWEAQRRPHSERGCRRGSWVSAGLGKAPAPALHPTPCPPLPEEMLPKSAIMSTGSGGWGWEQFAQL